MQKKIQILEKLSKNRYRVRRWCCGKIDIIHEDTLKENRACHACKKAKTPKWGFKK